MAEDAPVVERRKVIIEYQVNGPRWAPPPPLAGGTVDAALVEAVRRELIKIGDRNGDIFGGRA